MDRKVECFVQDCKNSSVNGNVRFYRFPAVGVKNLTRCRIWAKFAQPSEDWEDVAALKKLFTTHKHICSDHFKADAFRETDPTKLTYFSIPTLSIPDSSTNSNALNLSPLPFLSDVTMPTPVHSTGHPSEIPHMSPPANISVHTPQNQGSTNLPSCHNTDEKLILNSAQHVAVQQETSKKGRRSLLQELNVTRTSHLTPRKQKLVKNLRKITKEKERLKKENKNMKKKNRSISDIMEKPCFKKFPTALKLLMESTLHTIEKNPKGRRWSLPDKIQALTLFKSAPRNYGILRKMFPLPSPRTLRSLLNKIPFQTGVNRQILEAVKKSLEDGHPSDKYCSLMFDEMSIRQHLAYNRKTDEIDGYQNHKGQGVSSRAANHALVFMIQGLRRSFKQPIAFYLSNSSTSAERLQIFLKTVIRACRSFGIHIVNTVCDMGTNNVSALKKLGADFENPFFYLDGERVFTIYDPCHLIKCTRNNFMSKSVSLSGKIGENLIKGEAKWEHILKVVKEDQKRVFRMLHHITDDHLAPEGSKKMKVRLAAQIFSHSVAGAIENQFVSGILKEDVSAMCTALFVKKMDDLFDSLNGRGTYPYRGKVLRTRITEDSPHLEFYKEMVTFIRSLTFAGHTTTNKPPSQDGWIATLKSMRYIWMDLKGKGFLYLDPKTFNQDPIENLFGIIRASCGGNNNPNVVQFIAALKTAIINNFAYADLKSGNCEYDNVELLNNLQVCLQESEQINGDPQDFEEKILNLSMCLEDLPDLMNIKDAVSKGESSSLPIAYISGFIARKIMSKIACDHCENGILTTTKAPCHSWIISKEYNKFKDSLTYPTEKLVECVAAVLHTVDNFLFKRSYVRQLKETITKFLLSEVNFSWLEDYCSNNEHIEKIKCIICESSFFICIKWFCKRKNREFSKLYKRDKCKRKMSILNHK